MLTLKDHCRYHLLVATSMGVRIAPVGGNPVQAGGLFTLQATSAETNVASVPAFLGLKVKVLTNFVEGSPVARFIREDLQRRGMDVEGPWLPQGGPWGYRHQFNIADSGFGPRGPRVWNDRSGEVGRCLRTEDFDLENLFGTQGVRILHLSGLIAALSPESGAFCLSLAKYAVKTGTRVSFDLNYRASFWEGREQELRSLFTQIASCADILIGNEEDFQLCLGIDGPETDGKDIASAADAFKGMILKVRAKFPGAGIVGTTLREVIDANRHLWGAVMSFAADTFCCLPPREIGVLDRIGGGDGFVGGLLYGILKGWEEEKCAQFGWACGAMAASLPTDYAQPADEAQVWSIYRGNARVVR